MSRLSHDHPDDHEDIVERWLDTPNSNDSEEDEED